MGAHITAGPRDVVVDLKGIDGILAFKRQLTIPNHLITNVRAIARRDIPHGHGPFVRAPGTHIPGLVRHGSYRVPPHREFWAAFGRRPVLLIEVRDWDYARVVLGVRDPEMQASTVASTIG